MDERTPLLRAQSEPPSTNTTPTGRPSHDRSPRALYLNLFPDDTEFQALVWAAERAINMGIYPERIAQGSSGSYFAKNEKGEKIAVFKPKDEEPYGHLNPKWIKWMHRCLCPCCFGRSCILPNQGYLSEAGASLVDECLGLDIVPKTKVVRLASETFNYTPVVRAKARTKQQVNSRFPQIGRHFHRIGLPPKIGSMQTFVRGFLDADFWLRRFDSEPLPSQSKQEFIVQFQKLVVLDYIIRNTDRGNDNWLIRCDRPEVVHTDVVETDTEEWDVVDVPRISVAAIDNGLAFPYKHPDQWRAYPFQWSWLNIAKENFTDEIRDLVLEKLQSAHFVTELERKLKKLFKIDKSFNKHMFLRQMSVMRGQIVNLTEALQARESPEQLVLKAPIYVSAIPCDESSDVETVDESTGNFSRRHRAKPVFSWC